MNVNMCGGEDKREGRGISRRGRGGGQDKQTISGDAYLGWRGGQTGGDTTTGAAGG
jgi:hypothetical protein